MIKNFSDFVLSAELQQAIADMGFVEPTPIQALAIAPIMDGRDVIGQAQTGTGKTAAFGIPILERIDAQRREVQALILSPTRELAVQIAGELKHLAKHKGGVYILPVYGGQPIERQLQPLSQGVQIVVGTPGRVRDHLERRTLRLDRIRTVVLDEADKMLDMGFIDEIRDILYRLPRERQTLLFSATIPEEVLGISRTFQRDPQLFRVAPEELTVPGVKQTYMEVPEHQKVEILSRLIDNHDWNLALVFCNTKRKVDRLEKSLRGRGYEVAALHGDLRQSRRDQVMGQFREGHLKILVATDVAARGLDIEGIDAVINYDLPEDLEIYVHRIGRTARAGKTGRAYSFAYGNEQMLLTAILEYAKTDIAWQPLPRAKKNSAVEKAPPVRKSPVPQGADSAPMTADSARLYVSIGRRQRVKATDIAAAIANGAGVPLERIGPIRILDRYSFVDVPQTAAAAVIAALNGSGIQGHPVSIQPAKEKGSRRQREDVGGKPAQPAPDANPQSPAQAVHIEGD